MGREEGLVLEVDNHDVLGEDVLEDVLDAVVAAQVDAQALVQGIVKVPVQLLVGMLDVLLNVLKDVQMVVLVHVLQIVDGVELAVVELARTQAQEILNKEIINE